MQVDGASDWPVQATVGSKYPLGRRPSNWKAWMAAPSARATPAAPPPPQPPTGGALHRLPQVDGAGDEPDPDSVTDTVAVGTVAGPEELGPGTNAGAAAVSAPGVEGGMAVGPGSPGAGGYAQAASIPSGGGVPGIPGVPGALGPDANGIAAAVGGGATYFPGGVRGENGPGATRLPSADERAVSCAFSPEKPPQSPAARAALPLFVDGLVPARPGVASGATAPAGLPGFAKSPATDAASPRDREIVPEVPSGSGQGLALALGGDQKVAPALGFKVEASGFKLEAGQGLTEGAGGDVVGGPQGMDLGAVGMGYAPGGLAGGGGGGFLTGWEQEGLPHLLAMLTRLRNWGEAPHDLANPEVSWWDRSWSFAAGGCLFWGGGG